MNDKKNPYNIPVYVLIQSLIYPIKNIYVRLAVRKSRTIVMIQFKSRFLRRIQISLSCETLSNAPLMSNARRETTHLKFTAQAV
jgi:hypothetical protein